MKLKANNFTGTGEFTYKIVSETLPNRVELSLHIMTPFSIDWIYVETVVGLFNSEEEKSTSGLIKALKAAEKAWNLSLIKEQAA